MFWLGAKHISHPDCVAILKRRSDAIMRDLLTFADLAPDGTHNPVSFSYVSNVLRYFYETPPCNNRTCGYTVRDLLTSPSLNPTV